MTTASIVTFNHSKTEISILLECALNASIDRIYVIDNSDQDYLRAVERISPKIRYIHNENIGYGKSNNIAIRAAIERNSEFHIILNPDIHFESSAIEQLTEYMRQHPEVGHVMPKILYPNGDVQHLCKLLPNPIDLLVRRFIPIKYIQDKLAYRYELHASGYDTIMEVPSLSGCFMFLRCSTLIKSGLFDGRFFMYAEDLDLCRRIGEISKTIYYPRVSIIHNHEKGSYKSRKLLKYHIVSVIKYFNKWGWFFDKKRRVVNRIALKTVKNIAQREQKADLIQAPAVLQSNK